MASLAIQVQSPQTSIVVPELRDVTASQEPFPDASESHPSDLLEASGSPDSVERLVRLAEEEALTCPAPANPSPHPFPETEPSPDAI